MQIDWQKLQHFQALAEAGSILHAARSVGVSATTFRSSLSKLESDISAKLFTRTHRGIALTARGKELLKATSAVSEVVDSLSNASSSISGGPPSCTISCSQIVYRTLMEHVLGEIITSFPELELKVFPSDEILNLNDEEVDISIRHSRPTQQSFVAVKLGALSFGVYAPSEHLQTSSLTDLPIVLSSRDGPLISTLSKQHQTLISKFSRRVTVPSHGFSAMLLATGRYAGAAPVLAAEKLDGLTKLDLGIELPKLEVWICRKRVSGNVPMIKSLYSKTAKELKGALRNGEAA